MPVLAPQPRQLLTLLRRQHIVPKAGVALSEDDVIAHCRAQIAHFKVPKKVLFAESLPKNPSGKVLKRELRTRYEGILDQEKGK